jgi:hypothetical protein
MSVWITFADGTSRDGVGDVTEVTGLDLSRHRKNSICLFDHGKHAQAVLPIGLSEDRETRSYTVEIDPVARIAKGNIFFYQGHGAKGLDREKDNEHALYCEQIYHLILKGLIRGGSFGYMVLEASPISADYVSGTPQGLHLKRTLLLEFGPTIIPANQNTVRKSYEGDPAREILCMGKVCGKSLSPVLVKSLTPYAGEAKAMMVTGEKSVADMSPSRAGQRQLGDDPLKENNPIPELPVEKRGDKFDRTQPAAESGFLKVDPNDPMLTSYADSQPGGTVVDRWLYLKSVRAKYKKIPPARWRPGLGAECKSQEFVGDLNWLKQEQLEAEHKRIKSLRAKYKGGPGSGPQPDGKKKDPEEHLSPKVKKPIPGPKHKVGSTVKWNGHPYKVTKTDDSKLYTTYNIVGDNGDTHHVLEDDLEGKSFQPPTRFDMSFDGEPCRIVQEKPDGNAIIETQSGRRYDVAWEDIVSRKKLKSIRAKYKAHPSSQLDNKIALDRHIAKVTSPDFKPSGRRYATLTLWSDNPTVWVLIDDGKKVSVDGKNQWSNEAEAERAQKKYEQGGKSMSKSLPWRSSKPDLFIASVPGHDFEIRKDGSRCVLRDNDEIIREGSYTDCLIGAEVRLRQEQKSLTPLRRKYRPASGKGFRRRLRKSVPGSSLMYVSGKDLEAAKALAEQRGLKFMHLGSGDGHAKVKLIGGDDAIDEVAREYGKRMRR